jgi:hypothetical protein
VIAIFDEYDHMMRGFQITFSNGYKVSIINGRGSYSDGRLTEPIKKDEGRGYEYTDHAEVAIIAPDGSFENGEPEGWCDADRVAAIITEVSQRKEK